MICAAVERCAGIDVGKKFLAVCIMTGALEQEPRVTQRRFLVVHRELDHLRDWLQQEGVTHVVMESTGSYWKPVFNVLEDSVKVYLANPQEVKIRKGHKTDEKDSWWLAHLLRHAMIHPSFIPPGALRELRDLTRRRGKLTAAGTAEKNRVQKILEDANVKLGNVLSDVFGAFGQLMLEALLEGQAGPQQIAQRGRRAYSAATGLSNPSLRKTLPGSNRATSLRSATRAPHPTSREKVGKTRHPDPFHSGPAQEIRKTNPPAP